MSWYQIMTYLPFVAGGLVGAGLMLLLALFAVSAFFWGDEE